MEHIKEWNESCERPDWVREYKLYIKIRPPYYSVDIEYDNFVGYEQQRIAQYFFPDEAM